MLPNSSSIAPPLAPPLCSFDPAHYPHIFSCFLRNTTSSIIFTSYTVTNVLLLPLQVLVLWIGFCQWRDQRGVAFSHVCTYCIAATEAVTVTGLLGYCLGMYTCSAASMTYGYHSLAVSYPPQMFLHCWSCVERYVAVVHPITYRGLTRSGRSKVGNAIMACTWLVCVLMLALTVWFFPLFPTDMYLIIHVTIIFIVSFCSLSVLHTMIRLGLRKVGGAAQQIDPSKRRAFYSILIITGGLVLRSCGLMVTNIIFDMEMGERNHLCVLLITGSWLYLPSTLAPPLLLLSRAENRAWLRRRYDNNQTG